MKTRLLAVLPVLFLAAAAAHAREYHLRNDLRFENVSISGQGKSNSFLTKGNNFRDSLSLGITKTGEDYSQSLNINFFATDDPRLQPGKVNMRSFLWQMTKGDYDFSIGDIFADFSEYSLNAGVKGIDFSVSDLRGFDIELAGGIAKSDWRYLWEHDDSEIKDTYHAGINVSRDFSPFFGAALIYVFTTEDKAANQTLTADLNRNNLVSFLWRFTPGGGLKVTGESAFSSNEIKGGSSENGTAHRIKARVNSGKIRSRLMYERVGSDFFSPGGLAIRDREKVYAKTKYYYSPHRRFFFNYTFYRDNLDGRGKTTYNHLPEAGFRAERLFGRRHLSAGIRTRFNKRYREDKFSDTEGLSTILTVSDRIREYEVGFSYTNDIVNDKTSLNDNWTVNSGNLNVSRRWFLGETMLKPAFSLNAERRDGSGSAESSAVGAGFGLDAEIKQKLSLSFSYNLSNAANTQTDDLRTYNVLCSAEYDLSPEDENSVFSRNSVGISYSESDSKYQTSSQNYTEKVFSFFWKAEF